VIRVPSSDSRDPRSIPTENLTSANFRHALG